MLFQTATDLMVKPNTDEAKAEAVEKLTLSGPLPDRVITVSNPSRESWVDFFLNRFNQQL